MAKPKLTDWFPGEIKPVRDGVYIAVHGGWQRGYARWHEGRWLTLRKTLEEAIHDTDYTHGASQDKDWRGLASDPRASA